MAKKGVNILLEIFSMRRLRLCMIILLIYCFSHFHFRIWVCLAWKLQPITTNRRWLMVKKSTQGSADVDNSLCFRLMLKLMDSYQKESSVVCRMIRYRETMSNAQYISFALNFNHFLVELLFCPSLSVP